MQIFHVDAFTNRLFAGNPAAVVPVESWPSEATMQLIAAENALSETAFFSPETRGEADYTIRWFTPRCEVDLCGHATLAAAHVLKRHLAFGDGPIVFKCKSGTVRVLEEDNHLVLDFPSRPAETENISDELVGALGVRPTEVLRAKALMAVYESQEDMLGLEPDMEQLARLAPLGMIVTARGLDHDFVCRYFAPAKGVPEDPVTGSAHCTLTPYWAGRLHKPTLLSRQVSQRGGEVFCRLEGNRVLLGGECVTYSEGTIRL